MCAELADVSFTIGPTPHIERISVRPRWLKAKSAHFNMESSGS